MKYHVDNIILGSLLTAYFYNRSEEFLVLMCDELIKRIKQIDCEHTDEGDIIYSALVIAYGDYGTSPRSGWFYDENLKKDFIITLEDRKAYFEEVIKNDTTN